MARWQSGYAAACKAVNTGSIPVLASILARVAELVDATDLKSVEITLVPVRVRPWAPKCRKQYLRKKNPSGLFLRIIKDESTQLAYV